MFKFRDQLKVRDVITFYHKDVEMAEAISRNLEAWNLVDIDTGEPLPLPEPGTDTWFLDLGWDDWLALAASWGEWRTRNLPKPSASPS
jgi:hypothetical protein